MTRHQNVAAGAGLVVLGVLIGAAGITLSTSITRGAPAAALSTVARFSASVVSLGGLLIAVVLVVLAVRYLLKGFRE